MDTGRHRQNLRRARWAAGLLALLVCVLCLGLYVVNRFHSVHYVGSAFLVELTEGQARLFVYRDEVIRGIVLRKRTHGWSLHPATPFFRYVYQTTRSSSFHEVFIPYWQVGAPAAIAAVVCLWALVRRRNPTPNVCPACGYALAGLPRTGAMRVCPECGRPTEGPAGVDAAPRDKVPPNPRADSPAKA